MEDARVLGLIPVLGMFTRPTSAPLRYTTAPSSYKREKSTVPVAPVGFLNVNVVRK